MSKVTILTEDASSVQCQAVFRCLAELVDINTIDVLIADFPAVFEWEFKQGLGVIVRPSLLTAKDLEKVQKLLEPL